MSIASIREMNYSGIQKESYQPKFNLEDKSVFDVCHTAIAAIYVDVQV